MNSSPYETRLFSIKFIHDFHNIFKSMFVSLSDVNFGTGYANVRNNLNYCRLAKSK